MDGYGNYAMHQQQVSTNFYGSNQQQQQQRYQSGTFGYPGDWAGEPLIKSSKKAFNESSISRLAAHTHGAPIIMSSRYRSKSVRPMQSFGHEHANVRNRALPVAAAEEIHNYDDSGFHGSTMCLPRILKPRKRRKKDRKPITSMENRPSSPFTFASDQSNGFTQSMNAAFPSPMSEENFKRPAPPNDSNLFFNCDFDPSTVLPLPSSASSSPISLSNSSLSSSTTASSCSCRLCDPNCKLWAFSLRRSFSDNSAVELGEHIETSRKDVGVIGGNRVKTEWSAGSESNLSILDMIEFNDYQQKAVVADNRLRSESSSDSGDSGCDLLMLGGINISADDIISSTIKTIGDITSEGLSAMTKQLSQFSLIRASEMTFPDNDNLPQFQFNTVTKSLSSCEFSDHQRRNLDNLLATSGGNYGSLMSPLLVNKQQNFSNNLDLNNNPAVDGKTMDDRTLFDCFDTTWKGS